MAVTLDARLLQRTSTTSPAAIALPIGVTLDGRPPGVDLPGHDRLPFFDCAGLPGRVWFRERRGVTGINCVGGSLPRSTVASSNSTLTRPRSSARCDTVVSRGLEMRGERDVVEADDADVVGHAQRRPNAARPSAAARSCRRSRRRRPGRDWLISAATTRMPAASTSSARCTIGIRRGGVLAERGHQRVATDDLRLRRTSR